MRTINGIRCMSDCAAKIRRNNAPLAALSRMLIPLVTALVISAASAATPEPPDEALRLLLRQAIEDSSSFADQFDAEVWLTDMSGRLESKMPAHGDRVSLLRTVHEEAARAELPPELVLAVIEVESNFDRWAISDAGAQGLMQVMPFWLNEIGRPQDDLFESRTNLRLGCTILRYYIDKAKGDLTHALARYNGSYGSRVYPQRVFDTLAKRWYRQ